LLHGQVGAAHVARILKTVFGVAETIHPSVQSLDASLVPVR
jgi:hypothetical protein